MGGKASSQGMWNIRALPQTGQKLWPKFKKKFATEWHRQTGQNLDTPDFLSRDIKPYETVIPPWWAYCKNIICYDTSQIVSIGRGAICIGQGTMCGQKLIYGKRLSCSVDNKGLVSPDRK